MKPAFPRDLMVVDGKWQLVYSSTLALPSTPLQLPTPLLDLAEAFPLAPRAVGQDIDVLKRRVVNKVSLAPWPAGTPLSMIPGLGSVLSELESYVVALELDHAFSVDGEGGSSAGRRMAAAGSVIELRLEKVRRTLNSDGGGLDEDAPEEWVDMMNPFVRSQQQKQNACVRCDCHVKSCV